MKLRVLSIFCLVITAVVSAAAQTDSVITQVTSSNKDSYAGSVSGDGRFVVFESTGNLATENPRNEDGNSEIFLWDFAQRRIFQITDTKPVLKNSFGAGTAENIKVDIANKRPMISRNGRWIAFGSNATTSTSTAPDATNPGRFYGNEYDIPITTTLPCPAPSPSPTPTPTATPTPTGSPSPSPTPVSTPANNPLQCDGNMEVWLYEIPAYAPVEDLNAGEELPLSNLSGGAFTRVTNSDPSRFPLEGTTTRLPFIADDNHDASINDDGGVIAFASTRDLVAGGNSGTEEGFNDEIFTFVRGGNIISQVTRTPRGTASSPIYNKNPVISGNGNRVAFASTGDNPIIAMTGGNNPAASRNEEIFFSDLDVNGAPTGVRRQVTVTTPASAGALVNLWEYGKRMSRNGQYIAFDSYADLANEHGGANQAGFATFVYDAAANTFRRVLARSNADAAATGGDVARYPGFTDYDESGNPATIALSTRMNILSNGTVAANAADGLNNDAGRPVQIYTVPLNTLSPLTRLTKFPISNTFLAQTQALTSDTRARIAFNLGLTELGGGNSDLLSEVYYLYVPGVTSSRTDTLEFSTGASGLSIFPTTSTTPPPTPAPTPTPTPGSPTPTPAPSPSPGGRSNFALASNGGTATASSQYSSAFPAAAVNNGDRKGVNWGNGGGWNDSTSNAFPDSVELAFNGTKTIDEISVFTVQDNYASPAEPTSGLTFSQYGATAFDVQYWNGSAWVTVPSGSVTGNNNVWRRLTFSPVQTTKIRVQVTAALAGYSRLVEVEAWGTDGAGNPAPTPTPAPGTRTNYASASNGAAVAVSSQYSAAFPASALNNGDRRGSDWGNGGGWNDGTSNAHPDWAEITFSGSRTVDEVNVFTLQDNYASPAEPTSGMTFSQYGATAFDVQYWTGAAWQTVPGGSVTGNNKVWNRITFSPVETSKIRVLVNNALAGYTRLAEIEAWGGGSSTPAPGGRVNVALAANGAAASASSVYSAGFPAAAAINGDRTGANWGAGGGWNDNTSGSHPDSLEVAFAGTRTIDEIDVFTLQDNYASPSSPSEQMTFSQYGATAFDVQYWNGTSWVTVPGGSVTGNSNVWRRFTFAPVETSKIRVQVNAALAGYSRLVELEAWGTAQAAGSAASSGSGHTAMATGSTSTTIAAEAEPGQVQGASPGMLTVLSIDEDFGPAITTRTVSGSVNGQEPDLPIELSGVSMTINGHSVGMKSVDNTRIVFTVPKGLASAAAGTSYPVVVNNQGTQTKGFITIVPARPDIFSSTGGPGGRALAFNVTNTPFTPEPFSVTTVKSSTGTAVPTQVRLYLTGVHLVPSSAISIRIGTVTITGAQILTGAVLVEPGVYTVDFELPAALSGAGDQPIVVTVTSGGATFTSRLDDTAARVSIQ